MEERMGEAENKQVVERMFAALSNGDLEGFLGCLAEDVRYTVSGTTRFSGTFEGHEAFVTHLAQPLMEELDGGLEIVLDRLIAEGDLVVAEGRGRSQTKKGESYNNSYCFVLRVVDGKVKENTEYIDTQLVASRFG
jgi:ketosteroid isomerase-like protein